jgi:Protein of unknown function (DUF2628)
MATYEIHGPLTGERGAIAEALRATSPGFSYAAFVFGPFWLALHRLWVPLAIYLASGAVVAALASFGALAPGGALGLELTAAVFLGFEGPRWRAAALARRGRPLLDLVEAGSANDAADLFILRSLAEEPAAPPTAAPPPPRRVAPLREPQVLGLFPEARRR